MRVAAAGLIFASGFLAGPPVFGAETQVEQRGPCRKAILFSAEQIGDGSLAEAISGGAAAVVLRLDSGSETERLQKDAATRIVESGLRLDYFIEVGRSPRLADAHPLWMASIQGHQDWRERFPECPRPGPDQVVKCHPWVPIHYQQAFDAHLAEVDRLLKAMPAAERVYLNDLQAAPSACGCGSDLCRWTPDYGPITTATPSGPDAAARFVREVQKSAPSARVVPVWTTECDKGDPACGSVPCYRGTCWKVYRQQVKPLLERVDRWALQLTFRELRHDRPRDIAPVHFTARAISLALHPPGGDSGSDRASLAPDQTVAVLQGWNVTQEEIALQVALVEQARLEGYVLARCPIDQTWKPVLVSLPPDG